MARERKATSSQQLAAPPEPDEEVIEALLARFVARQNERLAAERARRAASGARAKPRSKRAVNTS